MHNKKSYTRKSTRVFAFFMCIILLLNIGCAYADVSAVITSGEGKAERDYHKWRSSTTSSWFIQWIESFFIKMLEEEEKGSFKVEPDGYVEDAFRVININARTDYLKNWYLAFKLSDNGNAGAYKISVFYQDLLGHKTYLKYKLCRQETLDGSRIDNQNTVPLCITENSDTYGGLPDITAVAGSDKDTSVNVILEKDYLYGIYIDNPQKNLAKNRPITIMVKDITPNQGGKEIFYSNIPSGYISMRCALEDDNGRRAPTGSEFKTIMIDQEVIDYYLRLWGFKRKASDSVELLPVESAATALIIFFGEIILFFGEHFLSIDNLTLDNLIFNKLGGKADPVIDLRGLGRNNKHRR